MQIKRYKIEFIEEAKIMHSDFKKPGHTLKPVLGPIKLAPSLRLLTRGTLKSLPLWWYELPVSSSCIAASNQIGI